MPQTDEAAALRAAMNSLGHRHAEPGSCFYCTNLAGLILAQRREAVAEDRAKVDPDTRKAALDFMRQFSMNPFYAKDLAALLTRRESALQGALRQAVAAIELLGYRLGYTGTRFEAVPFRGQGSADVNVVLADADAALAKPAGAIAEATPEIERRARVEALE